MIQYRKFNSIHPCVLSKDDLIGLVDVIKKGFPKSDRNEDIEIYSTLSDMNIFENSIDTFLKHKNLPSKINNLSIKLVGLKIITGEPLSKSARIDKSVELNFRDDGIKLCLIGDNEEWVLGKSTQILNYLRKRRAKIFILSQILFPISSFFAGMSLSILTRTYSATSLFILLLALALGYLSFENKILPYTNIIIKSERGFINKDNIGTFIAIISLIILFIGTIIIPLFVE